MHVTMLDANIRGCESRTNKSGDPYLLIRVEDSTGEACNLVDKTMAHKDLCTRDTDANISLDISVGKFTTIRVTDIQPIKKS